MSPEGGESNPMINIFMFAGILLVLYFFMIRPQAKRAKDQKKFAQSIGKDDSIVTMAGIHGKIIKVNEDSLIIESEGGTKLKIERSAVSMENTRVRYPKNAVKA